LFDKRWLGNFVLYYNLKKIVDTLHIEPNSEGYPLTMCIYILTVHNICLVQIDSSVKFFQLYEISIVL
ncbi:hypothetical protein ECC1470_18531, partial [Escherichia coli ECC-1470]